MRDRIEGLADKVYKAAAQRRFVEGQIERAEVRKKEAMERQQNALMAKGLVLSVAQQTQANIGTRISSLVSLALAAVFDDPYQFKVAFVQRRGVTEADLLFVKDDNAADPMSSAGGGALDIASFALRLAVWSLAKTRPLFILDEPFRNLSLDLQAKAGLMLKSLSEKLGIQVIMVSHNPEIISGADRVFRLTKNGVEVEDSHA